MRNPTLANRYPDSVEITQVEFDLSNSTALAVRRMQGTVIRADTFPNRREVECQGGSILSAGGLNYEFHESGRSPWKVRDQVTFISHIDAARGGRPTARGVALAM